MDENDKKTILLLLILLPIVIIASIVINYSKKVENKNRDQAQETNSSTIVEQQSSMGKIIGEKIDFPNLYDDNLSFYFMELHNFYELLDAKEIRTNYKNLKKVKDGKTYTYNCDKYLSKYSFCIESSLTYNGKTYKNVLLNEKNYSMLNTYGAFLTEETINDAIETFKDSEYDKYYSIGRYYIEMEFFDSQRDLNSITIYDGINEVYSVENNIKTSYYLTDQKQEEQSVSPIIINNVLHFVERGKNSNSLKYNTIDLTKDKIEVKLVKEFNGYYYQG